MLQSKTELENERTPLESKIVLYDRFEIRECLGMGGFCCTYLAWDSLRENQVAIRELFPDSASRLTGGYADLGQEWTIAHELRRRFTSHATQMGKIQAPGNLPVIATFEQLGTAFSVSPYFEGISNLQVLITQSGALDSHDALLLFQSMLEALEAIHRTRLHHDIRPSNILFEPGRALLIDPGAAREWEADRTDSQLQQFLSEIAAPEVLRPNAHRGPASDVYALCASIFAALLPNLSRTHEEATPLELIEADRPDLPSGLKIALDRGLQDSLRDRAKSASELIGILQGNDDFVVPLSLADFDSKANLIKSLRFQKRQCPSCQIGILEQPRPLKPRQCPACRDGTVRIRPTSESQCPCCRDGTLARIENLLPTGICPHCRAGVLKSQKSGIFKTKTSIGCTECNAKFEPDGEKWLCIPDELNSEPVSKTAEKWLEDSGRSQFVYMCKACGAQFDQLSDGRRRQAIPANTNKYGALYPEQWARIASHLPASGGNAECDSCGADYVLTDSSITLINVDRDPYHSCDFLIGRHLSIEELRWLGVGKSSKEAGFVCADCGTEFDRDLHALKLIHSSVEALKNHLGRSLAPYEWHRIGLDLPESQFEDQFNEDMNEAIIRAYVLGEIGLEHPKRPDLLWDGPAVLFDEPASHLDKGTPPSERQGKLLITNSEVSFGGLLRKLKLPLDSLRRVWTLKDGELWFDFGDQIQVFRIEPIEIVASLESGTKRVQVTLQTLLKRLERHITN
jgi:serine/threonine protein kinase